MIDDHAVRDLHGRCSPSYLSNEVAADDRRPLK